MAFVPNVCISSFVPVGACCATPSSSQTAGSGPSAEEGGGGDHAGVRLLPWWSHHDLTRIALAVTGLDL